MELTISLERASGLYGLRTYTYRTRITAQLHVTTLQELTNFLMIVKDYEQISLRFDHSISAIHKQAIIKHISETVTL